MGYFANVANAIIGRQQTRQLSEGGLNNPANSIADVIREAGEGGEVATSQAAESVTPRRVFSLPALYQAVSMISGDVAKLPLGCYRRLPGGGRTLERNHHAFNKINLQSGRPNPEINAFKLWRRLMISALLWNNGYLWIDKNQRGEVLGLYNLLPDRTTPQRKNGSFYYVTEVKRQIVRLEADEVFHLEGPSLDGFQGENVITLFKDFFGQALAKRRFSSKFFAQGMTAGGMLIVPPGATAKTIKKVQDGVKEKFSNSNNAFKTLVLRDGYKWFSTQVDPEKAQLTEWNEQDVRDIARIYNLRASRLSVKDSTSYNSDEQAARDYHDGTLSHWLIAARCEANLKLRTEAEIESDETFIDYNINALHWADSKTRSEIANTGILNGRFSPNETRAWENLNPYEGGDQFYRPLNVDPVEGQSDDDEDSRSKRRLRNATAAERIALLTLDRAKNRAAHRIARNKLDDAERGKLAEMIADACVVLGRSVGEELAIICKRAELLNEVSQTESPSDDKNE